MDGNIKDLSYEQQFQLLQFLLYRMGMDTRHALMTNLPVVYSVLFPGVEKETILNHTRKAMK